MPVDRLYEGLLLLEAVAEGLPGLVVDCIVHGPSGGSNRDFGIGNMLKLAASGGCSLDQGTLLSALEGEEETLWFHQWVCRG